MLKEVKKVYLEARYSNPIAKESKYKFENRSKDSDVMLMVLAGYKPLLWSNVFRRLKNYCPDYIDVCLVSSGKYSDELSKLCEKNHWSYLSLKRNNINLAQNTAISLFKKANYIIKMDEDIFVTEHSIENLISRYEEIKKDSKYYPGTISPLINLNGYSYLKILEAYGLVDEYKKRFGEARFDGHNKPIEHSIDAAEMMWGITGELPKLDDLSREISTKIKDNYSACPIRLTIGMFLMERSFWEDMGMFRVRRFVSDFGNDENEINKHAIWNSKAMLYDHSTVVGHFSFHYQDENMQKVFKEHTEYFN